MNIRNSTDGRDVVVPMKDKSGRERGVCILKYVLAVDPQGRAEIVRDDSAVPRVVDECHGPDPATSSIRRASDLFDEKPGTDVVLAGHAHPPPNKRVTHVDVALKWGPVAKTVRAHGLRVWQWETLSGLVPGPARPIQKPVPLMYELAWGGFDTSDPTKPVGDPRNYLGRGVSCKPKALVGQPAAQLELPSDPIGGRDNTPASFGPLHRHWEPRARFAGTYDEAWERDKMPLLPDDFDPRFHISVPPDQWSELPLRGDEPVEITGATEEGSWRFQLPRVQPGFSVYIEGKRNDLRTHLDTIVIDADAKRVELVWRATFPMPRKYEMVDEVHILKKRVV